MTEQATLAAPRQARAERTRQRILDAAAAAFAEHGHDGVSLNQVIRDSGLTKGAFYFHFPSRDALALASFRHKQRQLVERMLERVDPQAPPLERLAALLRERARLLEEDRSFYVVVRLGIELTMRHGPDSEYASFAELPLDLLAGIVRDGQRSGDIRRELHPRRTAEAIFSLILGSDQAALMLSGDRDAVARAGALLDVLVAGLATRPQPKEHP